MAYHPNNDVIKTRPSTKEFRDNWDAIFGKKRSTKYDPKDAPDKPDLKGKE